MGYSAVFFVGKGSKAEFIFGQDHSVCLENVRDRRVLRPILCATSESEFRQEVEKYSKSVRFEDHIFSPGKERETWKDVAGYSYVYSFFGGHAWVTDGGRWFNPFTRVKRLESFPPAPITHKGTIEGYFMATCTCGCRERVTVEEFQRWVHTSGFNVSNTFRGDLVQAYLYSKGFLCDERRGWQCRKCLSKTL